MLAVLIAPSLTNAQTFDFQGTALGTVPGATLLQASGSLTVAFSGTGLAVRDIASFGFPAGSSRVLSSAGDASVITMLLQGGATTTSVTFRNWISGVHTSEVDAITMSAFDAGDNLLGSITGSSEFLTLDFAGITKVTWDHAGTGYVLDEIVLNSTNSVVPEPSTYVLMASGLAMLAGVARRRRNG